MKAPSKPIDLAIIGGTGVYALTELSDVQTHSPSTRFGAPSGPIRVGTCAGKRVAFLARHGEDHGVPPHRINYRANLAALQAVGAKRVLALNTVGGITQHYGPRVLGCPDQLIDYTWGRISTLCEGDVDAGLAGKVLHVDFGQPYTTHYAPKSCRQRIAPVSTWSMVVATAPRKGPRLETRAEIVRMRRDGCDLVGMTGMPEAALARELGLDYACLAIVANWAAGAGPTPDEAITIDDVLANVGGAMTDVSSVIAALLAG